jgi:hypothetical protein
MASSGDAGGGTGAAARDARAKCYEAPMCNLYSLTPKRDAIALFFRVSHNRSAAFEPVNAIFPRHVAPIVRTSADGEREIVTRLRTERPRSFLIAVGQSKQ